MSINAYLGFDFGLFELKQMCQLFSVDLEVIQIGPDGLLLSWRMRLRYLRLPPMQLDKLALLLIGILVVMFGH